MSNIQFITNVVLFEDGTVQVLAESTTPDEVILQVLQVAVQTVASNVRPTNVRPANGLRLVRDDEDDE
jgi:hypothetical protein